VNNITKKFGMLEIKIEQAAVTQSAETARLVVEGFARDFKGISAMVENEALERVQSILKNIAAETEKTMSAAAKTGSAEMIERMNGVAEAIAQVSEDIRRAKVGEQVTSLADAAGVAQTALSDSASEFRAVVAEMKKLEGRILAIDSAADGGPVLAAPRTTEYAK
jgi:molecular chaperone GrpE (heat shock protein)